MNVPARLRALAHSLFHRVGAAREIDEELRSHIAHRADDLVRTGMNRARAERQARVEFGGLEHYKEESREAQGGDTMRTLLQDVRLSVRVLRKSPGFLVAAVITLALAIGANAVVFGVMNAFILRPLNVPHPESLYGLWRTHDGTMYESYPDYLDLRDRNHSFENLIAYGMSEVGLDTGDNPTRAWAIETSGNYFDALGLEPYLGHFFHASDERGPNSAPYIVLTYAYWHSHFQDDRGVVGRVVRLNKHPYTIIGVGPADYHGTLLFFNPDFFIPLVNHAQFAPDDMNARKERWIFMTMGHLKAGVTPAQAAADLNSIGADLERRYPKEEPKMDFALVRPSLYGDYMGRPIREFLTGLMLLAGLILVAACANLGSLFAARASDRSREVALRLALGSSRTRILRALFTEAILISSAGAAVGLAGSVMLLHVLSAWRPISRWPLYLSVDPDAHVYLVALLLALASGFIFGSVPVRQVLRSNPYEIVKSGLTGSVAATVGGRRITVRDILLVVQIAICALLVTSSMVAVRGLARSLNHNFGFDVENSMLVESDLSMAGYSGDRQPQMQRRMLDAVENIPGVESAALADSVPLGVGGSGSAVFAGDATDLSPRNAAADSSVFKVSPEYFHAAGTALLSGREFTWNDDKGSTRVAVINRELARKLFGSMQKAMGSHFKMPDGALVQVVGVAEDGKYGSINEDPQPAMFLPLLQSPSSETDIVVHSSQDPLELAAAIHDRLRALDSGLPAYIQTRYRAMDTYLFGPRMATMALGVMGLMGAMLSITGIFGLAAYSVSKRRKELGIRVALGAQRKEVLRTALGRAIKLLAFGSGAGLLLGLLGSPVLAFIVYQATPRDPLVLAGAVLAMLLVGLAATWIPAQRALSVNPVVLLRED
jgi:predicted permease